MEKRRHGSFDECNIEDMEFKFEIISTTKKPAQIEYYQRNYVLLDMFIGNY